MLAKAGLASLLTAGNAAGCCEKILCEQESSPQTKVMASFSPYLSFSTSIQVQIVW